MTDMKPQDLTSYYEGAESWAADRTRSEARSRRIAWIVAGCAVIVAVCEALALVFLAPLKTVEPYTLLVDRQTGYVEALKPTARGAITPDAALVRSMLVQYVIARENFDIDTLQSDYRRVALWSAGEARERYLASMQASNPASPLVTLPRRALVETHVRSVSALNADTALVRFATFRTDPGGQRQEPELWAAVLRYRFTSDAMSAQDRFTNPLGFQVIRYRRDAEIVPPPPPVVVAPVMQSPVQGARRVSPR